MNGFLDPPRNLELIGWAWNPDAAEARLRVEIAVDGRPLRRCTAAGYRPDLCNAGIGDGRHAFSLELPRTVFDGHPHTIAATVDGEHIGGSPMQFQSFYTGGLQRIGADSIGGWLRDESRPEAPVTAEVYADGRFLGSGSSGRDFEIHVPLGFHSSRVRKFELYAKGSAIPVAAVEHDMPSGQEPVDIVVYANKGFTRGLRTVESMVRSNLTHPHDLFVVPADDDNGFADAWTEAAGRLGFQCLDSLDSALLRHPERDLLLVEGDTKFGNYWLDRLHRIAHHSPSTATVYLPDILSYVRRDYLQAYIRDTPGMSPLSRFYPSDYAKGYGRQHILVDPQQIEAANFNPHEEPPSASRHSPAITANLRCTAGTTVWLGDESFQLPEQDFTFLRFCQQNNITRFRIESIVDAPLSLFDLGIPYEIAVWDFSWICPRVDLIDETGRYCGEPINIDACERCLHRLGPRDGWGNLLHRSASVAEMRDQNRHILEGADLVHFPSPDARQRIARYAPNLRAGRVAAVPPAWNPAPPPRKRPLQAGFYGDPAILEACRWDARKRNLPIEFVDPAQASVTFYANTSPDMQASIDTPTLAFDLGATAECMRLARLDHLLLPPHASPSAINDALIRQAEDSTHE